MAKNDNGFQGELSGLSLADILQIKAHNLYSGCITVSHGDRQGMLFFSAGELIHAEQGLTEGEQAVYDILTWPSGSFKMQPVDLPPQRTIQYSLGFLLLEAHRRIDEQKQQSGESLSDAIAVSERRKQPRPAEQRSHRTMSAAAARVMKVDGVTDAVLLDKQGQPVQDKSQAARELATAVHTLADAGTYLGALLGMGELRSAVVKSGHAGVLLYDSRQHYLGIALDGDSRLETVEAGIRAALAPGV